MLVAEKMLLLLVISLTDNRDAGDLRRHRAHYDIIVMNKLLYACPILR